MAKKKRSKNKHRPEKYIRERCKFRCDNRSCKAELLSAEEKADGYCHKCSLILRFKKKIEERFKD